MSQGRMRMISVRRFAARCAVAVALSAGLAACSGGSPAPTTPPTQQATVAPTASPTSAPTDTPAVSPTPAPTPASEITAAPTPASTPSPTPTSIATSVASACTGNADHQAFFAEASSKLPFDVYCASLPSGWYLQDGAYVQAAGGKLTIDYKGPGGATLSVAEGAFCTTSVAACSTHASIRGTASFGDKPGMLDVLTTPPDVFIVYVNPGTKTAYQVSGTNLTQARFVALAADMTLVPKS